MIALIGLGANLPAPSGATPLETCRNAVAEIARRVGEVVARSRWYRSAPVPPSDQPWYVNGVIAVAGDWEAAALLAALHAIERAAGRERGAPGAARVLDLDLLALDGQVIDEGARLRVPHPRLAERAFVLRPLAEAAPAWRHPLLGLTAAEMLAALPPGQVAEPIG